MTRRRKLLTAGGIIAVGLMLAWPFRKTGTESEAAPVPPTFPAETLRATNGDPIASAQAPAIVPVLSGQVVAHTASTGPAPEATTAVQGLESFDVANHPALASGANSLGDTPTITTAAPAPSAAQPAYSTAALVPKASADEWPAELIHVVVNGDTLEKLAERYLNDPGRALEIFDLNRDQLSNPHLLPIGVELRVPQNPDRIID